MSQLPAHYWQSRSRFVRRATALGARLGSAPVATLSNGLVRTQITPAGWPPAQLPGSASGVSSAATASSLTVDWAELGDLDSDRTLVLLTGVHGVEGYAGSACLQRFFERYDTHYRRSGIRFLLVHALNPWGFTHDARVTDQNVDLNRNFVDFALPLPDADRYARFHQVLCESYRPGLSGVPNELRLLWQAAAKARRHALKNSITGGQHGFANGLFFGGTAATQNRRIWEQLLMSRLAGCSEVRLLDIHTGLGAPGEGALISHAPGASDAFRFLDHHLDGQLTSHAEGDAVSSAITGSLPAFTEQWLNQLGDESGQEVHHLEDLDDPSPGGVTGAAFESKRASRRRSPCRAHCVTLEFGVASPLRTLRAMRADNWLRQQYRIELRGSKNPTASSRRIVALAPKIHAEMRAVFVSTEQRWLDAVLERFEWTVERLLESIPTAADVANKPAFPAYPNLHVTESTLSDAVR